MDELILKLQDALLVLDYGRSDLYSGMEGLPDYRANESSRDYLSQSESYIIDAMDMLTDIVAEMNTEEDTNN